MNMGKTMIAKTFQTFSVRTKSTTNAYLIGRGAQFYLTAYKTHAKDGLSTSNPTDTVRHLQDFVNLWQNRGSRNRSKLSVFNHDA